MNTQATTPVKSNKEKAQSVAVTAVKAIVYPAHLVCQTAADILCIGQAQIINKIDGTPVFESVMEQQSWTQKQQAVVVGAGMKLKDKWDRQREANRQQDAARLKAKLDKLEGVEHIAKPENVIVPAPPVEKKQGALSKAIEKAEQRVDQAIDKLPLMTPAAAFAEGAIQ